MSAPSPTAVLPPSAAPAPRSGPIPSALSSAPSPERGEFSVTFRGERDFEALNAAEAWLTARGFSDGLIKTSSLSFREGPVTVVINRFAPASVLAAFNLSEEDLIDRDAQEAVEART